MLALAVAAYLIGTALVTPHTGFRYAWPATFLAATLVLGETMRLLTPCRAQASSPSARPEA